jgi:NTP pyrophosphatase (non-canonical NTP hydrolase)
MSTLTFAHLREQNLPRCRRWHPEGTPPWSHDDWLLALGGEVGEALNVVKKLNRDRDGLAGNTRSRPELIADLGSELADVIIYLDITLGWDEPDQLLGGRVGGGFVLDDFTRFRERVQPHRRSDTPSRLGNRLFTCAGDQLYGIGGRRWANDVLGCADHLAEHFGIDLGAAVVTKFNATSERFGFPERLAA